ncbi:Transport and Golgi organization 2-like [Hondaea fermentalgiana]|uniref:Transport and Golgi organization 2-like n=1 Tax=Hondaea fermentalgiana TaxID=2315210 RepID=A0A2R5GM52_9STRA|nr:Transport and Golgi organization 2-like [Hondaea fermentalgiana]|eukprot:GBG31705.1 Transport and Golgi organization 2-like [Hondaea fermentalgiana]
MCITFVYVGDGSTPYKYIIGANRDEFMARPCKPAHAWHKPAEGHKFTFAGQDLTAKGTWLGVRAELLRTGAEQSLLGPKPKPSDSEASFRLGLVTNVREKAAPPSEAAKLRSRGDLITHFLSDKNSLDAHATSAELAKQGESYAGYNLLLGDKEGLYFVSNRNMSSPSPVHLQPGVHGMSNGTLDDNWPKVVSGKQMFADVVEHHISKGGRMAVSGEGLLIDGIFRIMADTTPHGVDKYTGAFDRKVEHHFSSIYVKQISAHPNASAPSWYGTRSTAVILVREDGTVSYSEKYTPGTQDDDWIAERYELIYNPSA